LQFDRKDVSRTLKLIIQDKSPLSDHVIEERGKEYSEALIVLAKWMDANGYYANDDIFGYLSDKIIELYPEFLQVMMNYRGGEQGFNDYDLARTRIFTSIIANNIDIKEVEAWIKMKNATSLSEINTHQKNLKVTDYTTATQFFIDGKPDSIKTNKDWYKVISDKTKIKSGSIKTYHYRFLEEDKKSNKVSNK
jgi:hypothetical protein